MHGDPHAEVGGANNLASPKMIQQNYVTTYSSNPKLGHFIIIICRISTSCHDLGEGVLRLIEGRCITLH